MNKKPHVTEKPIKPCSAFIRRQQDEHHCSRCGRTWDIADRGDVTCEFSPKKDEAK